MLFDRTKIRLKSLSERDHKLNINKIAIHPDSAVPVVNDIQEIQLCKLSEHIKTAKKNGKPVMITYGAHLIKNGLAPLIIRMIEDGWVTHLATNGAGSIHDWEFAYLGESTEDVRENTARGEFGIWDETGKWIGLAVALGVVDGLGYGWSIGRMIAEDGLTIPPRDEIKKALFAELNRPICDDRLGALSDLLYLVNNYLDKEEHIRFIHNYKQFSVQFSAFTKNVPLTVHPGIGYDIIYTHPMCSGGAIGRGAMRDFLSFAESVSRLSGGVHIAIGSAIMAPMIFEKSMSMANNIAIQETGKPITDHYLAVVDIQDGGNWDWSKGEPPKDNPAYYLRFCKSFYRMGGTLDYICMDNRAFLLNLCNKLKS